MSDEWKNIYQLYAENGNKSGFYVKRHVWGHQYFLVDSIGGQSEGPLPFAPPYHKNPPVNGRFFDGSLVSPGRLPSPGCYQWIPFSPKGK